MLHINTYLHCPTGLSRLDETVHPDLAFPCSMFLHSLTLHSVGFSVEVFLEESAFFRAFVYTSFSEENFMG